MTDEARDAAWSTTRRRGAGMWVAPPVRLRLTRPVPADVEPSYLRSATSNATTTPATGGRMQTNIANAQPAASNLRGPGCVA